MSEAFNIGDRVKVVNWPDKPNEPSDVNGKEGEVVKFHEPYVIVELDEPPAWFDEAVPGLYCRPDELELLK